MGEEEAGALKEEIKKPGFSEFITSLNQLVENVVSMSSRLKELKEVPPDIIKEVLSTVRDIYPKPESKDRKDNPESLQDSRLREEIDALRSSLTKLGEALSEVLKIIKERDAEVMKIIKERDEELRNAQMKQVEMLQSEIGALKSSLEKIEKRFEADGERSLTEKLAEEVTALEKRREELLRVLERLGVKVEDSYVRKDEVSKLVEEVKKKTLEEALDDKRIQAVENIIKDAVSKVVGTFAPAIQLWMQSRMLSAQEQQQEPGKESK